MLKVEAKPQTLEQQLRQHQVEKFIDPAQLQEILEFSGNKEEIRKKIKKRSSKEQM